MIKRVVAEFDKTHPGITVKIVGGINDDKIIAAIRAGNAPDVAQSFTADNIGTFCGRGAWIDLEPLHEARQRSTSTSSRRRPQYYTQYKGKRCALPVLADTYGLYYNKKLLKEAGITAPPKTISELTADAKKLTERNPDGSLKVVGFDPCSGFYENAPAHFGPLCGASGSTAAASRASPTTRPGTKLLKWQKNLIDWYGYDNLVRFQAGAGDEFSASNAFETGKLAMNIDGEWRIAFIKTEHPELNYGTAPMPVDDAKPSSTAPAT